MERIPGITIFLSSFLFLTFIVRAQSEAIDITTLGAKADGSDISKALTTAWEQACKSTTPSTIVIPKGTFALKNLELKGPCQAPVEIQVQGTVQAPKDHLAMTKEVEWLSVSYVNQLTLSGGGIFDGQGTQAWTHNDCKSNSKCYKLPYNFAFNFLNNTVIKDITSKDSKSFHFLVFGSDNVTFSYVTIDAPEESPNTDGIHIGRSNGVTIIDTKIGTGDDCISIGDGATKINITRVKCGPGHGISVGSLGRYPNELPVQGVYVNNCTISNTLNGVRVKSWPNMEGGAASDMHFDNIIMENVANPVIIDQAYCPHDKCSLAAPSKVKISKVSFNGITGTSTTPNVMSLVCSSSHPCEGVEVGDIKLQYTGTEGSVTTNVTNVKPICKGTQIPPIC